jgi:hypothetical protein
MTVRQYKVTLSRIVACLLAFTLAFGVNFGAASMQQAYASGPPLGPAHNNWLTPPSYYLLASRDLAPWTGNVDVSWYNTTDKEFHISTPAQLAGVAAIVNGIVNPGAQVIGPTNYVVDMSPAMDHYGMDDFSGKTIYIDSDMNLGGIFNPDQKNWTGPNFMPIGGSYCMDGPDGKTHTEASFDGVIDGQGHMLYNMFCNRYATALATNWPLNEAFGLVGRLGNNSKLPAPQGGNTLVSGIKRLGITGAIQGFRMVGGFVGSVGRPTNGFIIEQCVNYASIFQSDAFGGGGIVGQASSQGNNIAIIRNCYNAGYIMRRDTWVVGGICGISSVEIRNCYNYGQVESVDSSNAAAIGFAATGATSYANCYWQEGLSPDGKNHPIVGFGYYLGGNPTVNNCSGLSGTYMTDRTSDAFLDQLNTIGAPGAPDSIDQGNVFIKDEHNVNSGYPILYWQDPIASLDYQLDVQQTAHGTLEVSPQPDVDNNSLPFGTYVTLTATPDTEDGYAFAHYLVNGVKQTGNRIYMERDTTVSAVFFLRVSITGYHFAAIPTMAYTGSAITPQPDIFDGSETIILEQGAGKDYTLQYANNTEVGTATVTANGVNTFQGVIVVEFKITSKANLQQTITEAQDQRSQVYVSKIDGGDVGQDEFWISEQDEQNFYGALDDAQMVADYNESSQAEINSAEAVLTQAIGELVQAKQLGTMEPVSLDELNRVLEAAASALTTPTSTDGRTLPQTTFWVTTAHKTALTEVYNAAVGVLASSMPTAEAVLEATNNLTAALNTFNAAKKPGIKASAADLTAFDTAIAAANAAKVDIAISPDGKDIANTKKWNTQAAHSSFNAAINKAQGVRNSGALTLPVVNAAKLELNNAKAAFSAGIKPGSVAGTEQGQDKKPVKPPVVKPKTTSIIKITVGKKKMTVTWKKLAASQKVSKYQIRYRVKGKQAWVTKTAAATKSSLAITKLTKAKKYQVQVRSYKIVSKVKYYSAWSKTLTSKAIK